MLSNNSVQLAALFVQLWCKDVKSISQKQPAVFIHQGLKRSRTQHKSPICTGSLEVLFQHKWLKKELVLKRQFTLGKHSQITDDQGHHGSLWGGLRFIHISRQILRVGILGEFIGLYQISRSCSMTRRYTTGIWVKPTHSPSWRSREKQGVAHPHKMGLYPRKKKDYTYTFFWKIYLSREDQKQKTYFVLYS